jgi:pimeloyl-ACP methyl ester carboxylesterase
VVTLDETERILHLREAADLNGMQIDEIVLPQERDVTGAGLRLHVLDWGGDALPPVLFLHGGSLTAHTWDLVCLALRNQYHCLALDLRGHGDSDWSPDGEYSLDAHARDVEAAVEALGLDRFTLVGMSLGGGTALTYAGRNVGRLEKLVIVDTGPEGRAAGRQRIANFVEQDRELPTLEHFVERAMAFNPLRKPEMLRRSLRHNLRQTPRGTWTWKWDPKLRERRAGPTPEQRQAALWDAVSRITCPTLIVRGGKSENFHDEDAEKLASRLAKGSWVRIEGAGHTVQGDQPRLLVEALRPFFAGQGTQPAPATAS